MSIAATFQFDPDEHYRAIRAVTKQTRFHWIVRAVAAFCGVLAALLIVGLWGEERSFSSAAPFLIVALFGLVGLPLVQRHTARRLAREDPSVRGPQERVLDDHGFHSRGNGVALDLPWHAMLRGSETEQFFLFFYNRQCAYYLPKRVLTPSDIDAVRELARTKLGERAGV